MLKKDLLISQEGNQESIQFVDIIEGNVMPDGLSSNSSSDQLSKTQKIEKEKFDPKKQRLYDAKRQEKKSGIYQPTTLEQAKKFLKDNKLDIAELQKQKIWEQLQPSDIQKVNEFLKNEKKKLKKPPSENPKVIESKLIITQEQHNMIGNVQVCRNELISKEICASQNFENQVAVMLRLNRQNHLAIFDFLKSLQQEPFENFFEVLIEVVQATEDSTQQVRLLIGLFGIYNGQKLNPRADLCVPTLKYLANEDGVTSQQVIGFLKFTFITNGDIHNAELSDLISFDKRHQQCFVGFKQWLQWTFQLPQDLTLVLPNSCYMLGLPFAKRLQSESNVLTEHIPSDFLALFIQILVLTFEKDDKPFLDFTNVAKKGFLDLIEKIKSTQLINLFSGLLYKVRSHDKQWYLNFCNSRRLIEGALILVKENKVSIFNKEVCENLLSDVNDIDQYLVVPSILKNYTNQENDEHFRVFVRLNAKNKVVQKFLSTFDPAQSLSQRVKSNFQALKITPHFIQELAMKIISQNTSINNFLNIAPGLGKTKLILAVAIDLVQTTSFPVFILNPSKTLCDRDFQEAVAPLEELKIICASVISQGAKITFSTTNDFVVQKDNLPGKYHVLLDEYQNIFFVEKLFLEFVEIVKSSESFIGFSGSPLNSIQKKLLKYSFDKSTMVLQLTPHTDLGDYKTTICKTQSALVGKLVEIAEKYRYDTPQVFILDPQTAKALIRGRKNQRYEYLIDKEPAVVNNMLTYLFNKPNDKGEYGTYIINQEMGTGTDFKTSSDIENKGGLVLVFGIKPTDTSTFEQLSCRVGRIFNKSQRLCIIHDVTYTGSNKDYLKYQLKMLSQKECEEARALLSKLKPDINNSTKGNGESDDDQQLESSMFVENNKDIEMDDCTQNQVNHFNNEESNSFDDNDRSFDVQGSQSKLLRLQKQQNQHTDKNNKRKKKQEEKIILVQKKLGATEQCKFCEEDLVDPHVCKKKEKIAQSQLNGRNKHEFNSDENILEHVQEIMIDENSDAKVLFGLGRDERVTKNENIITHSFGKVYEQVQNPKTDYKMAEELKVVGPDSGTNTTAQPKRSNNDISSVEKSIRKSGRDKKAKVEVDISKVKTQRELIDEGYFKNYSDSSIHKEMINDKVRTETYQKAIELACMGKKVLDLGCGSGILSAFAIKSGAEQVFAVDNADIKNIMTDQLGKMGVDFTKIKYIQGSIESLSAGEIPQVDVIVSEWMGYFLLFENMIGSYIYAKRYLKADGIMIPQQACLYLNPAAYDTHKIKISKKYQQGKCKLVKVAICEPENLIQEEPLALYTFDFSSNDLQNPLDQGFSQDFGITVGKQGFFNAFVGSFDVKLYEDIFLNTMPTHQKTHWKQSLFFIDQPIEVFEGDVITGNIKLVADQENYRNLIIKFTYEVDGKGSSKAEECFTFE